MRRKKDSRSEIEVRFRLPEKLYSEIEQYSGERGERVGIFARHIFVDAYLDLRREQAIKDAMLAGAVFPDTEKDIVEPEKEDKG